MKLYYSAGSCSASCHIALEEAGMSYTPVEVSWDKNQNVSELQKLNPLGVAPVAVLDDGKVLTQNIAILEMIADKMPGSHLLAEKGTWERANTLSWLSFVASDLHKAFGPLFRLDSVAKTDSSREDIRTFALNDINGYLAHVDKNLEGKDYITGKTFTVADCYLFVVTSWCKFLKIPTDSYKNLTQYMTRVYQRPAVQRVLKAEGLLN
jgi:glutathione S-transferase